MKKISKEIISENNNSKELDNVEIIDLKTFKMPLKAEQTLDLYLDKIDEFYNKIEEDKKDIISQKAKVLEAVLGTDMLKIV